MHGPSDAVLPLTSNQASRLAWTEWVRAQGIALPPHHLGFAFRLAGPLDPALLRQALDEVVARHEALRATFPVVGGRRVQAIGPPGPMELEIVEVSDRGAGAVELATALVFRPFDLSRAPLLRAGLLRLGRDEHVLVLAAEHLVADAWSLKVVLEELSAIYGARAGALPRPPSWTGHVREERDWLEGPGFSDELDYWRRRMAGRSPVSSADLPMLGPTAPERQYLAHIESAELDPDLTERFQAVAASCRLTLFSALLAVLHAALVLRTGARDLVVLTPNGNRSSEDQERIVGWVANLMAVRTASSDDPTFRELARTVQQGMLEGIIHGRTPFDELVRALAPEHYGRMAPAGCTFFSLAPAWRVGLDLPGIEATPFPLEPELWTLGISVDCAESGGQVLVRASGDRGLYRREQVLGLVRDFVTLAERVVSDPDRRLSSV